MKNKILLLITILSVSFGLLAFSELNVSASTIEMTFYESMNAKTVERPLENFTITNSVSGVVTLNVAQGNWEDTFVIHGEEEYLDVYFDLIGRTITFYESMNAKTVIRPLENFTITNSVSGVVTLNVAQGNWEDTFVIHGEEEYLDVYFENEVDNKRPAISGQENFVTSVDDAKPLSYFQAFLSAYDETDGEVPVYVVTDNYTANKSVLGSHKVVFGAKDSSNNEATLEAYIRVVDITKPIITGNSSVVKIGYKETWNITNFKNTLTVTDNYDTLTNSNITVKTDNYTANKTKLGTYNVVFAVKDNSNNEGIFTKPVQVYDNVKPTFSGPTTIATSNNTIITESEVRSQLTAHDEIDGNITNKITVVEDNFTGKGNNVGNYTIKYKVTDNAGNFAEHTVTLQRSDKLPPVIWIQDGVSIKTTPTTPLTFKQITDILEATGQVTNTTGSMIQYTKIYDEYSGNEETEGIYAMTVRARSLDGNESLHNFAITVLNEETEGETIDKLPETNLKTQLIIGGAIVIGGIGLFLFLKKRK